MRWCIVHELTCRCCVVDFSLLQIVTKIKDSVAFPYRKSYFFDNKLEFLGIKLAESKGFGIPTSKFLRSENSQVILSCLGCFKFKPFVISDFNGIG